VSWDPILEGDLAQRARDVLVEVVEALATAAAPSHERALFWTYANASLDDDPRLADRVTGLAEAAMGQFGADLERLPAELALHGGLTGWAWTAVHVADGVEPLLAAVDAALVGALAQPWTGDYDLISGLVGFAVYLLERGDTPDAKVGLARIVEQLEARATRSEAGIAWFTPPEGVGEAHRARYPDGHFNCGVAHGVPGVIAVLGKLAAGDGQVSALRDEAARWLLAQRLPDGTFPAAAGGAYARTAWCYGDPGVVIALWDAVPRTTRDELAASWTSRPAVGIRDAGVCHGSAGLAHLANRMFQATRDPRYRTVARDWIADTLDRHRPGEGVGGFTMERAGKPLVSAGFLEGTIGVALVLLAGLAPIEPLWDRLLLCDIEPDQG
jgi:hypothetical protein